MHLKMTLSLASTISYQFNMQEPNRMLFRCRFHFMKFHETDTHLKAQGAVLDLERQWNLASSKTTLMLWSTFYYGVVIK